MTQLAENPDTGEKAVLIHNQWQKVDQIAANDKGEKAYLVGGKWITDPGFQSTGGGAAVGNPNLLKQRGGDGEPIVDIALRNAPAIGSIVGGVAGAAAGPAGIPVGAVAGATIGGLVGTAAGTSIGTSVKQIAGNLKGESQSGPEVVREQMRNVSEQVMYQAIGNVIGSGITKGINALVPKVREGAALAQSMLSSKGGGLSAAQASEAPGLNLVEAFSRSGAGGKQTFTNLDKANADALQAIKTELISSISKDPVNDRVAGKLFQDAIAKGDAAHQIAASALYKNFDARAGGLLVDTTPLKVFGETLVTDLQRIGNVGKTDAGGQLLNQLSNVPNSMTFADAHALRSNLLALIRDYKAAGTETKAIRNATLALKEVEGAMEQSAKNLSPDLFNQYRQISAFYKKGKDAFNNDIVSDLLATQPERVGESLFKTGNVSEIIQAKASIRQAAAMDKSVDPEKTFSKLQAGYLNQLLTSKSAMNIEGETTAQNLMKELANSKTSRQFAVMFNSDQREAIASFGRTAFLALRNKPAGFGTLAPILQAAAGLELASQMAGGPSATRSPGTDIGILMAPAVLSRLLTNSKLVGLMTRGIQLPAGSPAYLAVLTKISAEAATGEKP